MVFPIHKVYLFISKGLCHGQKCLHLFSDSKAYHEQMGPIPSSNGSSDILPYPMLILRALGDALFRPPMLHNWPRDRKLTQSSWRSHWFLGLRADVWKILLQVQTRPVVTQDHTEKMFNKNIEIGFHAECSFSPLSASISAIVAQL